MSTKFRLAACVLLPTGTFNEEILAVSRPSNQELMGIPGGKQEPNESNLQCAIREVSEEVGIDLRNVNLVPIFAGACYGADGMDYWVTTYLPDQTFSDAILKPEPGLIVRRVSLVELCKAYKSPFYNYNRSVMMAWRLYGQ